MGQRRLGRERAEGRAPASGLRGLTSNTAPFIRCPESGAKGEV